MKHGYTILSESKQPEMLKQIMAIQLAKRHAAAWFWSQAHDGPNDVMYL